MPHRIVISEQALASRGQRFRNMLMPLLKSQRQGGPAWRRYQLNFKTVVIATSEIRRGENYNEWFFSTFWREYLGNYYEVWIRSDNTSWYLEKAYLHIFRGEQSYFCLHCDPEAVDSQGIKACYKQSPHLHIKTPDSLIPKAHIALAHGYVNEILASEENLFKAMRLGVDLLCDEILSRIDSQA